MKQKNATPHFAVIQGLYWMAYCILISFSSVYLLERGFSNAQIGILISGSSLLAVGIQPPAAARADQMRRFSLRHVCAGAAAGMALAAAGLLLLPGKFLQAGLYMVLLVLLQLLLPFLCTLAMDCNNALVPLNYGLARGGGAVAYGIASAACGTLTALFGGAILPLALAALTAALVPALLTFRHGDGVKALPDSILLEAPQGRGTFFRKYPKVPHLLVSISLLYTSHNILMSFPYQIVQALGGGTQEMGHLLTLQSMADVPAMVCFSLLLGLASSKVWVKVSAVSFFLHALLTWAAPSMSLLFAIQFLETTGFALYAVASVYFVNEIIALEDRVQGQTWFGMVNTIGIVLGSSVGGILLDASGAGALLAFASLTGGAGMVILLAALRRPRGARQPAEAAEA